MSDVDGGGKGSSSRQPNITTPARAIDIAGKDGANATSVAERVTHIAKLMSTGRYNGYPTRMALCELWGVTDAAIRRYAAESHRLVSVDPEEKRWLQDSLAARCEDVRRRASTTFNEMTGMPDFSAELKAIELTAFFQGIDPESPSKSGEEATRIEIKLLPPDEPKGAGQTA